MLQLAPWGDMMQPSTNLGDEGGGGGEMGLPGVS